MRLFCLPPAGGSGRALAAALSGVADTVPLELPGRGARWQEQPYRSWDEATTDLAGRLARAVAGGGEYALLGHSLGAVLAYEIAHRLRARPPAVLVVVARNPPHRPPERTALHDEGASDRELFDAVVALGGASPRAAGPLTYRTFLPVLRADLRLAAGYRPSPPPVASRLVVLYAGQDALTSAESMPGWADYTTGCVHLHEVPGDHFFVMREDPAVRSLIAGSLAHHECGAARAS
ncbi:MAG TPA: alpha/beta fold hydrolase [Pseudonocardiaceae bacterium]|nr:alpha/beta fold hydrolase [Pseudonocardiaceae bacterium]